MTFDQYQAIAATTAQYKDDFYPIASLMVESAELSDLFIKPRLRGDNKVIDKHDIVSEGGTTAASGVVFESVELFKDLEVIVENNTR